MSGNKNVKKTGSLAVALILVAFGLFLVCGSQPPQISADDGGWNDDSTFAEDDLAGFLDEDNGNSDLAVNDSELDFGDENLFFQICLHLFQSCSRKNIFLLQSL